MIQNKIHSMIECGKSGSLTVEFLTGYSKMQVPLLSCLCDLFCLILRVRQSIPIVVIQDNQTSRITWTSEMIIVNPFKDSSCVLSLSIKIISKLTPSRLKKFCIDYVLCLWFSNYLNRYDRVKVMWWWPLSKVEIRIVVCLTHPHPQF